MKKVLLLDFDGVVLRNKVADIQVAKRAGIYTWRKVNAKHKCHESIVTMRSAEEMCYSLYRGYGHTLLGLKTLGIESSLKEYNHFVYSTIDYEKVNQFHNDLSDVKQLLEYCDNQQIPTYFFSNAPVMWIERTLSNEPDVLAQVKDIRTTLEISENDASFLKPQKAMYDIIDNHFDRGKVFFIDDNMSNLTHTVAKQNWTNVLFSNFNKKINKNMYIADGIPGLMNIV